MDIVLSNLHFHNPTNKINCDVLTINCFITPSSPVNGVPNGVNGGPPLPEHVMRAVNEQMQRFLQNTMNGNNNVNNNTVSGEKSGDSSGMHMIHFPCLVFTTVSITT